MNLICKIKSKIKFIESLWYENCLYVWENGRSEDKTYFEWNLPHKALLFHLRKILCVLFFSGAKAYLKFAFSKEMSLFFVLKKNWII